MIELNLRGIVIYCSLPSAHPTLSIFVPTLANWFLIMVSSEEVETVNDGIRYVSYESESQMPGIMKLIQKDLSEPYSIYTYRYFIHNWPKLCFLAMDGEEMVGAIVCKLDVHKQVNKRGYIAMLAVDERYRRRKIGKFPAPPRTLCNCKN